MDFYVPYILFEKKELLLKSLTGDCHRNMFCTKHKNMLVHIGQKASSFPQKMMRAQNLTSMVSKVDLLFGDSFLRKAPLYTKSRRKYSSTAFQLWPLVA